jgi:hypothetical protein
MNTVAAIEQVLSRGRKESTYKLAVLRALVDFVIEHPGREPRNGLHYIPVVEIARRVLTFYWRPTLDGIPQGRRQRRRGAAKALAAGQEPEWVIPVIERTVRDLAQGHTTIVGIDMSSPASGLALANWLLDEC